MKDSHGFHWGDVFPMVSLVVCFLPVYVKGKFSPACIPAVVVQTFVIDRGLWLSSSFVGCCFQLLLAAFSL